MPRISACQVTLVALVAAVSCSSASVDPIDELRIELEAAAEARDAERLGSLLSEEFRGDGGLTRAEALARLRRYFAAYESVDLEVHGLEVERGATSAEVRCVVEFVGQARPLGGLAGLLPPEAVYRFQLGVAEEAGLWRVRRATWQRVVPGVGS